MTSAASPTPSNPLLPSRVLDKPTDDREEAAGLTAGGSDSTGPTNLNAPIWQLYVRTLCTEVWRLDPRATEDLIARIEDLVSARELTDSAVAVALRDVGVSERYADLIAATIRAAVGA